MGGFCGILGRGARLINLPIDAYQGHPRKTLDPVQLGEKLTVNRHNRLS